jgi:hypothetical protein
MWRKAVVVSCARPNHRGEYPYNLGARKCADWLRAQGTPVVEYHDGDPGLLVWEADRSIDLVCLSVIFSWQAPIALEIALRMRDRAEIWCGGPGMSGLIPWWKLHTGLACQRGIDQRFDRQRGDYLMTFSARGCPVNCYFCVVGSIEGTSFTFDYEFQPAPVLLDNNLSALPVDFQDHIIARYRAAGVRLEDASSGFEPRYFTNETYLRWKPVLLGPFRFAFDEMHEEAAVGNMMNILRDESPKKRRVYVLIGNEPIEACLHRVFQTIAWGGEPHCQLWLQPAWLGDPKRLKTRFEWSYELGRDFCRYVNRYVWKYAPLAEYNNRQHASPPFANSVVATPEWSRRWEAALHDYRGFLRKSRAGAITGRGGRIAKHLDLLTQDTLFDDLELDRAF